MYPALFIGPFTVSTWRLVVLAAVIFTWMLLLKRMERLGYPTRDIFYWVLSGLFVGFVGAQAFNGLIPYLMGSGTEAEEGLASGMTVTGAIFSRASLKALATFPCFRVQRKATLSGHSE